MSLAPSYRKILETCHDMVQGRLAHSMGRMFENADIALLDFAQKAQSNAAQSQFFEAMNEVQQKSTVMERRFREEIARSFKEFPRWAPASEGKGPETDQEISFSLVNADIMEEDVALKNALGKLSSRIQDELYALKCRLSVMLDGASMEEDEIPAGPIAIIQAFQRALRLLEMETKVRLVIITLFDKFVIAKTPEMYGDYNKILVQANILPNLKYQIKKNPNTSVPVGAAPADPGNSGDNRGDADRDYSGSPSELGEEVFGTICQLLAGRHSAGGGGSATVARPQSAPLRAENRGGRPGMVKGNAGSVTGPALAPASSLMGSISQMQNHVRAGHTILSSTDYIENITVDENLINTLQQTLAEEREKILGAVDRRKVPSADSDVIDLVGMLFEYMLKEEHLPNVVKAALSRLHTPMLKVAILDRSFFTQSRHPARSLLNSMISAGIRWVDESHPETGIFPKIRQVIDDILMDFDDDVSVFESYLEEFEGAVSDLKHRSKTVEKRTNEAANGQEKLLTARTRAQQEIQSLCAGKKIIKPASDLLAKLWSDKLTFILLRETQGDQSEVWAAAVAMAKRIVESSSPLSDETERRARAGDHEGLQRDLRNALVSTQHAEKEAMLLALERGQVELLVDGAPENPADIVETPPPPPRQSAPFEVAGELSDAERKALKQLESIPFGTWFEFRDDATGKTSRVKLSWRSTVTQKFMFVDQMGVKSAIIPTTRLAKAIAEGSARILPDDKKPFMDRALGAIHRMLDRSVAETA